MERLIVGITTAPRDEEYLWETLSGLSGEASRTDIDLHVFPTTPGWSRRSAGARWHWPSLMSMQTVFHDTDTPLSLVENSDRLVRTLGRLVGEGGSFLQCQDDLAWCVNATDRIADCRSRMKGLDYLSFYTPYEARSRGRGEIAPYPPRDVYGTLCNLWNGGAAAHFADTWTHPKREKCYGARKSGREGMKGWDLMVKDWLQHRANQLGRATSARHIPCLVQHAGRVSSSGKALGVRRTMNFRRDYNATGERR